MKCSTVQRLLSPYFDQELDKRRHQMVRDHLDMCPECAAVFEEMNSLSFAIRTVSSIQAPPRFEDIVLNRARLMKQDPPIPFIERMIAFSLSWKAAALATPALALVLISLVMPLSTQKGTHEPELAIRNDVFSRETPGSERATLTSVQEPFYATPVLLGNDDRLAHLTGSFGKTSATDSRRLFRINHPLFQVQTVRESRDNSFVSLPVDSHEIVVSKRDSTSAICPPCMETFDAMTFFPSAKAEPRSFKVVASYR